MGVLCCTAAVPTVSPLLPLLLVLVLLKAGWQIQPAGHEVQVRSTHARVKVVQCAALLSAETHIPTPARSHSLAYI
jgi:hypothetical protein